MDKSAVGRRGEEIAAEYLCERGYTLRARNWRRGRYELDIVAVKDATLHFVEVKTRKAEALTSPEYAITRHKFHSLLRAARAYLAVSGWKEETAFDLVAVEYTEGGGFEVRMTENAMECNW